MTDAAAESPKKAITIDDIPWYTVPAILLGIPAVIAILSLIWPQVFFDRFVDPYYWSPIKGDTGYNAVNTVSWAILLGACLLGLAQMFTALKVKVDATFIYGAVAWVVTGSIFRVLEDTGMFLPPLQYVMITPPIYLLFAAFAIVSLLIGILVQRTAETKDTESALQKLWLIQSVFVLAYTLLWAMDWGQITQYLNPVIVALLGAFNFFVVRYWVIKTDRVQASELMFALSLAPFLMGLAYIAMFVVDPWRSSGAGMPTSFITVPLLAAGLVGIAVSAIRAGDPAQPATHRRTALFAAGFAVILGFVVWTAPEATRIPVDVVSVLTMVGIGLVLGGFGVLMARLMRHRAHAFYVVVLAFLAFAGFVAAFLVIEALAGRFNIGLSGTVMAVMALVVVAYFLWQQRRSIQGTHAYLKEQGSVSSGFAGPFLVPLNVFLVLSQVMDGFATSLGLDLAGYREKHVLSASIISRFEEFSEVIGWEFGADHPTFLAFVPIKLAISLGVIYAIDVFSKEDVQKHPTMIGLVKFAIIMVGIGPAVRDFVRLSLGV